ncbi:MAG TPA: hypothetical protein VHZ09_13690 [Acidobacteriaceae bacterium]|jgi:hypothetical protein|nr:hypothetical protein [Acidobacteriaceae bacterium]
MTQDDFEKFVTTIRKSEAALGELRARMRVALDDESLPPRSRVAEYRRLLNETRLYSEEIERAWEKLNETL